MVWGIGAFTRRHQIPLRYPRVDRLSWQVTGSGQNALLATELVFFIN